MLRAFQADANQPMRGNHDAGKILFGPDGKLYFQIGDQGRRGQLQNLVTGPFGRGQADDQFGGPAPDDAHLTGFIFRLNPDGTTPNDNPFSRVTMEELAELEQHAGVRLTAMPLADVVANIHKVFSYGRRNGFGLETSLNRAFSINLASSPVRDRLRQIDTLPVGTFTLTSATPTSGSGTPRA